MQSYGRALASLMFYDHHARWHPRDDAPRIIDVFSNPVIGKHLLVGIGKPRHIWVLYPVKGKDILCRGAVLPYYEFAGAQHLTDADWKTQLMGSERPSQPAWLRPIIVAEDAR